MIRDAVKEDIDGLMNFICSCIIIRFLKIRFLIAGGTGLECL